MDLMTKKSIGALVQTGQHYKKLYAIALELPKSFEVTFLIDMHHFDFDLLFTRDNKFNYVTLSSRIVTYNHFSKFTLSRGGSLVPFPPHKRKYFIPSLEHLRRSIYYFIKKIHTIFPWKFFRSVRCSMRTIDRFAYIPVHRFILTRELSRYFKKSKFDLLLMAEANIAYTNEIFIKSFSKIGKPTVIYPYTFSTPLEPATTYKKCRLHRYRKSFARLIDKKWIYEFEGNKLIRMPITQILAIEAFHCTPPHPWVQESCTANKIIAESERIKKHYITQGIPESQISVCGDINHDVMHASLISKDDIKRDECEKLGFDPDSKIVLFAVFPDCINYNTGCEFNDYYKMLEWITLELQKIDHYNLIICLHPALKASDFQFLETDRAKMSMQSTAHLLPIADLYVSSVSASIKMAIALGVPVFNYDVYNFKYRDYADVGGVLHIESKSQFKQAIIDTNKGSLISTLKIKQEQSSNEWGLIDGKSMERFLDLFAELTE